MVTSYLFQSQWTTTVLPLLAASFTALVSVILGLVYLVKAVHKAVDVQ